MYDAIVIGARCAGSPTAMLLARKGYKVLLLDQAEFPSDTISTHIVWPQAAAQLKHWGLLETVLASNCPIISKVSMDAGSFFLTGSPTASADAPVIAPRRFVLDKILVDAAVKANAELWENTLVEDLIMEDDRITGIRCRTKGGSPVFEKANVVIGADGRYSIVARKVNAQEYISRPSMTCWYYAYWNGVPVEDIVFYAPPNRAVGTIPTNDGNICVPVAWPAAEFQEYRSDIEANYLKTIEQAGIAELLHQGKRVEKFSGISDLRNYFRHSFGPGWALVGDAAYNKDPITAQGICDAFYGAESLSEAIDHVFSGKDSWDNALGKYQQDRDEKVMPMFELTCEWAKLQPPEPDVQHLFSALRENQAATDRFFGTLAGTVSIPEFYSPENLKKIIGALEGQEE